MVVTIEFGKMWGKRPSLRLPYHFGIQEDGLWETLDRTVSIVSVEIRTGNLLNKSCKRRRYIQHFRSEVLRNAIK
jgi:hypothetical protein